MQDNKPADAELSATPAPDGGTPLAALDLPDPAPAPDEPVVIERTNWIMTIGVGLILMALGFGAGFSARPFLIPAPAAPVAAAAGSSGASLLDALYASVRHYRGDPKAPVTVLEFGDFQ